jgi:hypothetical protein
MMLRNKIRNFHYVIYPWSCPIFWTKQTTLFRESESLRGRETKLESQIVREPESQNLDGCSMYLFLWLSNFDSLSS